MPLTNLQSEAKISAPRVLITGTNGIGKTTMMAKVPGVLFLCTEEGAEIYPAPRIVCPTFPDFTRALHEVENEDHEHQVLVVDTANKLMEQVGEDICQREGKAALTDFDYGKGEGKRLAIRNHLSAAYDRIRNVKGMPIVLLSQVEVKKYAPPDVADYDRFQPSYSAKCWAADVAWADVVAFAMMKTAIKEEKGAFGSTRRRAIGTGERVLKTDLNPAYIAKSRYDIPAELPMSWAALTNAISEGVKTHES